MKFLVLLPNHWQGARILVSVQAVELIKREVFVLLWMMCFTVTLAWKKATIKNINKSANIKWKDLIGGECPQTSVNVLFVDVVFLWVPSSVTANCLDC